jgi:hypothetical protein
MYYSYVEIEYVATSFSPARTDLALKLLKHESGKCRMCMLVMKKEKLNLRKFCLFSPAGTDLKRMIGRRIKFQIMQTTQAFVIVTSRIDDPINAKADARRMLWGTKK